MIVKSIQYLFIILSALILSACGLGKPVNMPAVSTYQIASLKIGSNPRYKKSGLTLLITKPVASPGYQTANMVYVMIPYKLKFYATNRWVAPPAQMILPLMAQRLRQTGYFHAVVSAPYSGIANVRLDSRLLTLQQEFLRPISRVHLVIEASLISNATNKVIANRRFQVYVNAPQNNPYSGVLATNRAVALIDNQIAKFVLRSSR